MSQSNTGFSEALAKFTALERAEKLQKETESLSQPHKKGKQVLKANFPMSPPAKQAEDPKTQVANLPIDVRRDSVLAELRRRSCTVPLPVEERPPFFSPKLPSTEELAIRNERRLSNPTIDRVVDQGGIGRSGKDKAEEKLKA